MRSSQEISAAPWHTAGTFDPDRSPRVWVWAKAPHAMSSGDVVAKDVRIADARLITAAPDLLALAKQYASECAMCGGTNRDPWNSPNGKPCSDCADIRAVIAKAEGRS